jgi:hypothetical protein
MLACELQRVRCLRNILPIVYHISKRNASELQEVCRLRLLLSAFTEYSLLHCFMFFFVCFQPSKSSLLIRVLVGPDVTCLLIAIRSFHAALVGVHMRLTVQYVLDSTVSKGNLIDSRTLWSQRKGFR